MSQRIKQKTPKQSNNLLNMGNLSKKHLLQEESIAVQPPNSSYVSTNFRSKPFDFPGKQVPLKSSKKSTLRGIDTSYPNGLNDSTSSVFTPNGKRIIRSRTQMRKTTTSVSKTLSKVN